MNKNEDNKNYVGPNLHESAENNLADEFYAEVETMQHAIKRKFKNLHTKALEMKYKMNCLMQDMLCLKNDIIYKLIIEIEDT